MIYDIIAVIGLVWIICDSRIVKPVREYLSIKNKSIGLLLNCWGCTSFWVGLIYFSLPIPNFIRFTLICVIISVLLQNIIIKLNK
jgi:hypothetical protein